MLLTNVRGRIHSLMGRFSNPIDLVRAYLK
jgi:hypothetical protein